MSSLLSKMKYLDFIAFRKAVFGGSAIKTLSVIGILSIVGGTVSAQELVSNGDFKANAVSFTMWPGTLGAGSNPATIPSWTAFPNSNSKGINGALTSVGNIFGPSNDGGYTYVYVQHNASGISQSIPMIPNTTYTLEIDIAGRNGDATPQFSVKFANSGETAFWDSNALNGGFPLPASQNVFTHYSVEVTAPADASGVSIQLWNESPAGDNTVVFANVSVSIPVEEILSITPPPNVIAVVNTAANTATNVAIFTPITTLSTSVVNDWSGSQSEFPLGDTTLIWTAMDAGANTVTATQTVSVLSQPVFSGSILPTSQLPLLSLTSIPSNAARIEASSNLMTQAAWAPLATFSQTTASVDWVDYSSTNVPTRFYRPVDLTALDTYANAPSDTNSYTWMSTTVGSGETTYVYEMVSQNWLTTAEVDQPLWKHWLTIVKPDTVSHATALFHITAGNNGDGAPSASEMGTYQNIARNTESVVAELRMVPNQPLTFAGDGSGRVEDDIMAYAWVKFMDHGDSKWVPRLPMVKAAVVAMDSITEIGSGVGVTVDKFVVTGASKRGWTSWASAIVDDRVEAIIPVVIDMLNLTSSLKHHWKVTGDWAPALGNYEAQGVLDRLDTPEWDALMAIEDPYEYRNRLTLPKFLINSACDEFFLPDSSQFYFDGLKGVKYLRYVPNQGHGLNPWANIEAYYYAVLNSSALPQFAWEQETENTIKVTTTTAPSSVKLWQAHGYNNDRVFRIDLIGSSAWTSTILTDEGGGVYRGTVANPGTGYQAYFIEMTYPGPGAQAFEFTTNVKVVPDTYPASWPPN